MYLPLMTFIYVNKIYVWLCYGYQQLQVDENYSYLFNLRQKNLEIVMFNQLLNFHGVWRRHILTYEDDPRTERIKIYL